MKLILLLVSALILSCYYFFRIIGNVPALEIAGQLVLIGLLIRLINQNIKYQIYPDEITLPAIGLGILINLLLAVNLFSQHGDVSIVKQVGLSLAGILLGGGILFALSSIAEAVLKKESIGGGDIKMVAMVGAFVGPIVIKFIGVWVLVTAIFALFYKWSSMRQNRRSAQAVPTAIGHYVSTIIVLSIQKGVLDVYIILLSMAVTFFGANYFCETETV